MVRGKSQNKRTKMFTTHPAVTVKTKILNKIIKAKRNALRKKYLWTRSEVTILKILNPTRMDSRNKKKIRKKLSIICHLIVFSELGN